MGILCDIKRVIYSSKTFKFCYLCFQLSTNKKIQHNFTVLSLLHRFCTDCNEQPTYHGIKSPLWKHGLWFVITELIYTIFGCTKFKTIIYLSVEGGNSLSFLRAVLWTLFEKKIKNPYLPKENIACLKTEAIKQISLIVAKKTVELENKLSFIDLNNTKVVWDIRFLKLFCWVFLDLPVHIWPLTWFVFFHKTSFSFQK